MNVVWVIGIALTIGVVWFVRTAWIPLKPCPRCGGKGLCGRCDFRGKVPKLGARMVRRAIGRPLEK